MLAFVILWQKSGATILIKPYLSYEHAMAVTLFAWSASTFLKIDSYSCLHSLAMFCDDRLSVLLPPESGIFLQKQCYRLLLH